MVFQQLFLWPHLTLRQNIILSGKASEEELNELVAAFGLWAYLQLPLPLGGLQAGGRNFPGGIDQDAFSLLFTDPSFNLSGFCFLFGILDSFYRSNRTGNKNQNCQLAKNLFCLYHNGGGLSGSGFQQFRHFLSRV